MGNVEPWTELAELVVQARAETHWSNARQWLSRVAVLRPHIVTAQVEIEITCFFIYPEFSFRLETIEFSLHRAK